MSTYLKNIYTKLWGKITVIHQCTETAVHCDIVFFKKYRMGRDKGSVIWWQDFCDYRKSLEIYKRAY